MDDRNFDELMQEALNLDSEHQRQLRDALDEQLSSRDSELGAEMEQRLEDYRAGRMQSLPGQEVLDDVRARISN